MHSKILEKIVILNLDGKAKKKKKTPFALAHSMKCVPE